MKLEIAETCACGGQFTGSAEDQVAVGALRMRLTEWQESHAAHSKSKWDPDTPVEVVWEMIEQVLDQMSHQNLVDLDAMVTRRLYPELFERAGEVGVWKTTTGTVPGPPTITRDPNYTITSITSDPNTPNWQQVFTKATLENLGFAAKADLTGMKIKVDADKAAKLAAERMKSKTEEFKELERRWRAGELAKKRRKKT